MILFFFFNPRCEGITSPEGSKSIVEGIIEEEEEDEEGSESVNKRKKEDDMEVGESPYSRKDGVGMVQSVRGGDRKVTLSFWSTVRYFRGQSYYRLRYVG